MEKIGLILKFLSVVSELTIEHNIVDLSVCVTMRGSGNEKIIRHLLKNALLTGKYHRPLVLQV